MRELALAVLIACACACVESRVPPASEPGPPVANANVASPAAEEPAPASAEQPAEEPVEPLLRGLVEELPRGIAKEQCDELCMVQAACSEKVTGEDYRAGSRCLDDCEGWAGDGIATTESCVRGARTCAAALECF